MLNKIKFILHLCVHVPFGLSVFLTPVIFIVFLQGVGGLVLGESGFFRVYVLGSVLGGVLGLVFSYVNHVRLVHVSSHDGSYCRHADVMSDRHLPFE